MKSWWETFPSSPGKDPCAELEASPAVLVHWLHLQSGRVWVTNEADTAMNKSCDGICMREWVRSALHLSFYFHGVTGRWESPLGSSDLSS